MNWVKRLAAWWNMLYHRRRGCDGSPIVPSGKCRCQCATEYLGL